MINLSIAATTEIKRLQSKGHNLELPVRLAVQTGGCAGLYYTIEFDAIVKPTDTLYEYNGISVVVDAHSLNYINDLRVDYSEDLMGGGFRFHNPKALQSCGCGNSFSVAENV